MAHWTSLRQHPGPIGRAEIVAFAKKPGIAPRIVIGRPQHQRHLPHTHPNRPERRDTWTTLGVTAPRHRPARARRSAS